MLGAPVWSPVYFGGRVILNISFWGGKGQLGLSQYLLLPLQSRALLAAMAAPPTPLPASFRLVKIPH